MIPVGKERDKRIAELSQNRICVNQTCSYYRAILNCKKYNSRIFDIYKCPKFTATSWSIVMMASIWLWHEMTDSGCKMKLEFISANSNEVCCSFRWKGVYISHVGEDEADSISGAYIKFKEFNIGTP